MDFNTLYEQERIARKEGKVEELKDIFVKILQICSDDKEIISIIKVLSARRGQNRNAIKWLIHKVYEEKRNQIGFVKDLLVDVIEGKMYLEAERVRVTSDLRDYYEQQQGDKKEALSVILNVPIETFTMVPEKTVIQYQLDQFRLCVELKDWVRSDITMRKIRKKYFKENSAIEEETMFYKYIVDLYLGQEKFLEASTTFIHLNEIVERKEYIVLASFFSVLCTCEGEKKDVREEKREFIKKLTEDKNNEEEMRTVLDRFLSNLLIEKPFVNNICSIVQPFCDTNNYYPFLIRAVDEHNFFVVEKFYKSISISTLCSLLDQEGEKVLERVSFMVNNKLSNAKINQKEGIIVFGDKKWASDVGEVLKKIIKVDHLIHKEKLK